MSKIVIGREFPDLLIEKVKSAKESIKILSFAWRYYPANIGSKIQQFNLEIVRACQRGVVVSALVNDDSMLSFFRGQNIKIKRVNSSKILHAKIIIIDQKILFLGSHNLTQNAFELSHEISIEIKDQEAINRCNNFFDNLCLL